jgi:hypothetical protein
MAIMKYDMICTTWKILYWLEKKENLLGPIIGERSEVPIRINDFPDRVSILTTEILLIKDTTPVYNDWLY